MESCKCVVGGEKNSDPVLLTDTTKKAKRVHHQAPLFGAIKGPDFLETILDFSVHGVFG